MTHPLQCAQHDGSPYAYSFPLVEGVIQGRKVLDLGCNEGYHLTSSGSGSVGVDIDLRSLRTARQRGFNVLCANIDLMPWPLASGAFETVVASHVLEHTRSPIGFLEECNRVLVPSGSLLLGLPIEDGLYSRLRYPYFEGSEGHLYSFSRANIAKLLWASGFRADGFRYHPAFFGFRNYPRITRLFQRLGKGAYHLSAAYWVVATRQGLPQSPDRVSSYFERAVYS